MDRINFLNCINDRFQFHSFIVFRYGLNRNYQTTTIFVLHLAFVDLLCCLVLGSIYASMYYPERWPWGSITCQIAYPAILFFTFIDWLSLSFVALSRCINLIKPVFWSNFCDKKINIILTLAVVWIVGGLWIVPDIMEVIL